MATPNIFPYEIGRTTTSISRDQQMRRDNDNIKVPKITLYDHDYAVYFHIQNVWKPQIIENDVAVPVPVMFSNGEKWSQIRAHGYLRDNSQKIQSPLIIIKRNDISQDERISTLPGQVWGGNSTIYPNIRLIPRKNSGMQFDKSLGQYQTVDSIEFYLMDVPDYIRISYDLIFWTDLQEQMNVLIQGLIPMSNHMWGDFYKFRTTIQSITPDNVNVPGEDRLVKTTINLQVDGYLRNEFEYQQSKIQKAFSVKKVRFLEESIDNVLYDEIQDQIQPSVVKGF